MTKHDLKSLDSHTLQKYKAATRMCMWSQLAYVLGALSLIPGIICALLIGFNYLNQESVRRFSNDPEFATGVLFFAIVAVFPVLCFMVYRSMKPKLEEALQFIEDLEKKQERARKVQEDLLYWEELEQAKKSRHAFR